MKIRNRDDMLSIIPESQLRYAMRFLGVDPGRRRVGLALSDSSGLLARPWKTVPAASTPKETAGRIAAALAEAADPDDTHAAIGAIVVGLPRRLNGEDNRETQPSRDLAASLSAA